MSKWEQKPADLPTYSRKFVEDAV